MSREEAVQIVEKRLTATAASLVPIELDLVIQCKQNQASYFSIPPRSVDAQPPTPGASSPNVWIVRYRGKFQGLNGAYFRYSGGIIDADLPGAAQTYFVVGWFEVD